MLVIRLFRTGKKNQPSFKLVIADKRNSSTRGRFVEEVGFINPLKKEKVLKTDRIKYWISVGAQPSATIHNLLIQEKIIEGKKTDVHKKKKVKEGTAEAASPVAAAPKVPIAPAPVPAAEPAPVEAVPAPVEAVPAIEEAPVVEEKKIEAPAEEPKIEAPKEPFGTAQGGEKPQ